MEALKDIPSEERLNVLDNALEQAGKEQEIELLVDFDSAQKEKKGSPKSIIFEEEEFLIPSEAPTDVAMYATRSEKRAGGVTGDATVKLIDLLFGAKVKVNNPREFTEGERLIVNDSRRKDFRLNFIHKGTLFVNGEFKEGDLIEGVKSGAVSKVHEVVSFVDLLETSKHSVLNIESDLLKPIFKSWGFSNANAIPDKKK